MASILHTHASSRAKGSKRVWSLPAARRDEQSCDVIGCLISAYGGALGSGYNSALLGLGFIVAGAVIAAIGDRVALWLSTRLINAEVGVPRLPATTARHGRRLAAAAAVSAALLLAVPSAGLAAPRADLSYGGLTSQGLPVYLELAPSGRSIQMVVGTLDLKCRSGDSMLAPDIYGRVPVSAAGRFRASYADPAKREGNEEYSWSGAIQGRFDRGRSTLRGSWAETFKVKDTTTGQTDTCSAKVPFTLRR